MARDHLKTKEILIETSLQSFFFDQLQEINRKFTKPLPQEVIFYSSVVLDQYGESTRYFEIQEGKVKEKILGLKLLESSQLNASTQKRVLRDVGDTALMLCGYFGESLNKKLIDVRYYQDLGRMAYERLNNILPEVYQVPDLFSLIARYFKELTELLSFAASRAHDQFDPHEAFIIVNTRPLKAS